MPAILSAQPAASRASPRLAPPDDWSAFLRLFDAYADSDRVVGASVLMMRDGRVLDRHDYGWADRAARQRHHCEIGQNAKWDLRRCLIELLSRFLRVRFGFESKLFPLSGHFDEAIPYFALGARGIESRRTMDAGAVQ